MLSPKPSGVDLEAAEKIGRKVIWALGLPGKYAPETAGEIVAQTVERMLREGGDRDG